jgi:hypothetical protein
MLIPIFDYETLHYFGIRRNGMAKSHRLDKIAAYLRPYWRETVFGIIALLVVNGLGVYIPLLIRSGVDTLSKSFSFRQIIRYVDDANGFSDLDIWCGKTGRI